LCCWTIQSITFLLLFLNSRVLWVSYQNTRKCTNHYGKPSKFIHWLTPRSEVKSEISRFCKNFECANIGSEHCSVMPLYLKRLLFLVPENKCQKDPILVEMSQARIRYVYNTTFPDSGWVRMLQCILNTFG
jgi:hypothetical protein